MGAPYTGGCLCGSVRYRVTEEPLTVYACHCTDCQRRTGAAFALSMMVRRSSVELLEGEVHAYHASLADGRTKNGQMCVRCGTRLWGEPARYRAIAVVQPGTLDRPFELAPIAHQWTRSALPWMVFPVGVARFEQQPANPMDLIRLWQAGRPNPGRPSAD